MLDHLQSTHRGLVLFRTTQPFCNSIYLFFFELIICLDLLRWIHKLLLFFLFRLGKFCRAVRLKRVCRLFVGLCVRSDNW